jgi:hypothetical protein
MFYATCSRMNSWKDGSSDIPFLKDLMAISKSLKWKHAPHIEALPSAYMDYLLKLGFVTQNICMIPRIVL